jgi:hypothetical protein
MKRQIFVVLSGLFILLSPAYSDIEDIDSEKSLSDFESQLELSSEKLKPVMEAKSRDLKQSYSESAESGFMQIEELSARLGDTSKEADF